MPELPDRFRALDQLDVPDIDARARALGPRPPTEPDGPSPAKRTTVIILAFVVAVAGVGLLFRAFRQDPTTAPGAAPAQELIALSVTVPSQPVGSVIALVRPDGSNFHVLTRKSSVAPDVAGDPWIRRYGFAADDSPTWSPDGTTIAFRRSYAEGVNSLCTMRVDGSDFRIVVRDFRGASPSWSPDGSTFAFYSERDGGIHLIDADGTNERVLHQRTGGPNQDTPSWSPDGRWVYFAAGDVFAAHPDGSGFHRVVDLPWLVTTAYLAPDGSAIAVGKPATARVGASVWVVPAGEREASCVWKETGADWFLDGWADASSVLVERSMPNQEPELWRMVALGADHARVPLPDGVGPYGSASGRTSSS